MGLKRGKSRKRAKFFFAHYVIIHLKTSTFRALALKRYVSKQVYSREARKKLRFSSSFLLKYCQNLLIPSKNLEISGTVRNRTFSGIQGLNYGNVNLTNSGLNPSRQPPNWETRHLTKEVFVATAGLGGCWSGANNCWR